MIVDDDLTTVKLLQTLLELDGFEVVVCTRGGDVVGMVGKMAPEVILMDYHLADTEGVHVLRELRSGEYAELPVIMTSGMDVRDEVMSAGANDFLVKPFEPDELPGLFRKYIN
jgi:DNA-binding response OmpR family regulator